jgi:hypothetical protein
MGKREHSDRPFVDKLFFWLLGVAETARISVSYYDYSEDAATALWKILSTSCQPRGSGGKRVISRMSRLALPMLCTS